MLPGHFNIKFAKRKGQCLIGPEGIDFCRNGLFELGAIPVHPQTSFTPDVVVTSTSNASTTLDLRHQMLRHQNIIYQRT